MRCIYTIIRCFYINIPIIYTQHGAFNTFGTFKIKCPTVNLYFCCCMYGIVIGIYADITAAFTNTKQGVVPTGVLLTVAPFAIGLLLFGALAVFFVARKKKRAEEE